MTITFPFTNLPELAQEKVLEFLDGPTILAMRAVSKAMHHVVTNRPHLRRKMQFIINNLDDIQNISSWPTMLWSTYSNFKINRAKTEQERAAFAAAPLLLSQKSHYSNLIEIEVGTKITYQELDALLRLPNLQVFRLILYSLCGDVPLQLDTGIRLEHLRYLTIPVSPVLLQVLQRAPCLRKLSLRTEWSCCNDRVTKNSRIFTQALINYINTRFYTNGGSKGRFTIHLSEALYYWQISEYLFFTVTDLLSICAVCHPVGVTLRNVRAFSLPSIHNLMTYDKLNIESLSCIENIYIGNHDANKYFPPKFRTGSKDATATATCLIQVPSEQELIDIVLPPDTLTEIRFHIDLLPFSHYLYHTRHVTHLMTQIFIPRHQLRRLEIRRNLLDLEKIVDSALNFHLFPNLVNLSIKRFGDDPNQFRALCEGLQKLVVLDVSHISDEFIIGADLEDPPFLKLTNLRSLNLSKSHITDSSLEVFGKMKLDQLIITDPTYCAVHLITFDGLAKLVDDGGWFSKWVQQLIIPKPADATQLECQTLIQQHCIHLHTLKLVKGHESDDNYSNEQDAKCSLVLQLEKLTKADNWT